MKKKIVLPSLFVLNAFLVGMTPKTSKAGSLTTPNYTPAVDSVSHALVINSGYWLSQKYGLQYIDLNSIKNKQADSVATKGKDTLSYNISWQGGKWVKYTSDDGSGFIRTGGSRTWRNMNPGAIRPGKISEQYGSCGSAGGFAVFPTEECGMNALRGLLQSDKYANLTIAAAVYKYAPPSDHNNTRSYQRKLAQMTGLNLSKKISQLTSEELNRVMSAIKVIEGWKIGTKENFAAVTPVMTDTIRKNLLQRQYNA